MEQYKTSIIQSLQEIRNKDIHYQISLQDQLVLIFKLISGETTANEQQELITLITQLYTACGIEIAKIEQMTTNSELENYTIPNSFLKNNVS